MRAARVAFSPSIHRRDGLVCPDRGDKCQSMPRKSVAIVILMLCLPQTLCLFLFELLFITPGMESFPMRSLTIRFALICGDQAGLDSSGR